MAVLIAATDGWTHMGGWDGGWMWLWGGMMMLAFAAVIGVIVWAAVRAGAPPAGPSAGERARDILAERYARGELTTDEYVERVDALR